MPARDASSTAMSPFGPMRWTSGPDARVARRSGPWASTSWRLVTLRVMMRSRSPNCAGHALPAATKAASARCFQVTFVFTAICESRNWARPSRLTRIVSAGRRSVMDSTERQVIARSLVVHSQPAPVTEVTFTSSPSVIDRRTSVAVRPGAAVCGTETSKEPDPPARTLSRWDTTVVSPPVGTPAICSACASSKA